MPSSDESPFIELLKAIQVQLAEQALEIRALRDTVIRLETHGYHEQIKELRTGNQTLRDKIIILETQGRVFTAGISAGVSIIVTVLGGLMLYAAKGG